MALSLHRRAILAPAPVFPLTIPWFAAWWASDPGWVAPADGGGVSSWRDGSRNGHNLTQATGTKQPIYHASLVGGKPWVSFDGVDDFLQTASWASMAQPNEIVVVGRQNGGSAVRTFVDGIGSATRNSVAAQSTAWRIDSGTARAGGTSDAAAHFFRAVFDTNDTLDVDGTNRLSGDAGSNGLTGITLGARYDGTANFGIVDISFVGLSDTLLTAQQRIDLLAWSRSFYTTP